VVAAMHNQMRAERTRRALVTEAQGDREAAITRAEGEKQAAILSSEGMKQSAILEAQGEVEATRARADAERYRQQTVAEGEADAVRTVYKAIHDGKPTNDLLAVKYLEALQVVANGKATKIFLPTEATALLGALGGMAELLEGVADRRSNGAKTPAK
jgi:regulator of protease activity HflC (stomatin/prohibitin superfamily)